MTLIDSSRITRHDRTEWNRLEVIDARLARSSVLQRHEDRAISVLEDFMAEPCYIGVSWGKDSVVVADLALRVMRRTGTWRPIFWIRDEPRTNPDCYAVRDAFFELHQDAITAYSEIVVEHDWDDSAAKWFPRAYPGVPESARRKGETGIELCRLEAGIRRWVSGIRAKESGVRKARMRAHGTASRYACAPIGWWDGWEVFAYLHKHQLPVHPVYAMSMGGVRERDRLRVSGLGGSGGEMFGRAEWEQRYYGDALAEIDRLAGL